MCDIRSQRLKYDIDIGNIQNRKIDIFGIVLFKNRNWEDQFRIGKKFEL